MQEVINSPYTKAFIIFLVAIFLGALFFNDELVRFLLSYLLVYKYTTLFIFAFLAGLCIPIPMNVLLIAIGALAINDGFNLFYSLATATAGNFLGDISAVLFFRKFGHKILRDQYAERYSFFLRLEEFFQSNAHISIFVSRIVGVFGTPVNFLSGYLKIPMMDFMIFNVLGNSLFVFMFLCLGFWVGDKWLAVSELVNTLISIFAGMILFSFISVLFFGNNKKY